MQIPSDNVVFNTKPDMKAREICEAGKEALLSGKFQMVRINFANPDMVGHTGDLKATIRVRFPFLLLLSFPVVVLVCFCVHPRGQARTGLTALHLQELKGCRTTAVRLQRPLLVRNTTRNSCNFMPCLERVAAAALPAEDSASPCLRSDTTQSSPDCRCRCTSVMGQIWSTNKHLVDDSPHQVYSFFAQHRKKNRSPRVT